MIEPAIQSGKEKSLINRPEVGFPTNPMERMELILGAAVNLPPKPILLLLLPQIEEYTETQDLAKHFRDVVTGSDTPFDHMNASRVEQFFRQSLEGIGMVTRALELESGSVPELIGYSITEAGEMYGRRAAALSIAFEQNNPDFRIYRIFGQTATARDEMRAPYLRAMILMDLYKHSNEQGRLVRDFTRKHPDVAINTFEYTYKWLETMGIIQLKKTEGNTHQVYRQTGEVNLNTLNLTYFGFIVGNACESLSAQNTVITIDQLVAYLKPEHRTRSNSDEGFVGYIYKALHELRKNGYLTSMKTSWVEQVSATLIPEAEVVVTEFLHPLLALLSDDTQVIEWIDSQVSPDVRSHLPQYARDQIAAYYPDSPGFLRDYMRRVDSTIIEQISESSTGQMSLSDLVKYIGQKRPTVRGRVKKLVNNNILEEKLVGQTIYYRIKQRK